MSETASFKGNQDHQVGSAADVALLFPGAEAPPLEGEELCICGQLEGEHRSDGTCPASGCKYFVAESDVEEPTNSEIRVEYEAGCEPAGAR